MSGKSMDKLRDMLCDELSQIAKKGVVSAADLDTVHKLTDTIKNIDKIEMLEGGYSNDGEWTASGQYSRGRYSRDGYSGADNYARESSYSRRGSHYVRGHYSMDDGSDMITQRIEEMMQGGDLSGEERLALRRAMKILGKEN